MKLVWIILLFFINILIILVLLLIFNPIQYANLAQTAILQEYVNVYCIDSEEAHKNKVKFAAQGALMSRLTIGTGLGSIALLEYAKCKISH